MAKMSYMGQCKIAGALIRCTSMSVTEKVEPLFFDHVIGLKDTNTTGTKGPGTGGGRAQTQKKIYRFSRTLATASVSGPLDAVSFPALMNAAIDGSNVSNSFSFYSGAGISLTTAFISSLSISINAGDVANFTAELTGMDVGSGGGVTPPICTKLATWDVCSVSPGALGDVVSFSISITNPPVPIYTAGGTFLEPTALRIGMQEVKGSIGYYSQKSWSPSAGSVVFSVAGTSYTARVVWGGVTNTASSGSPFISTQPFTGGNDGPVWS